MLSIGFVTLATTLVTFFDMTFRLSPFIANYRHRDGLL